MLHVSVSDKNDDGSLAFDLLDILLALEDAVITKNWRLDGFECEGGTAEKIQAYVETGSVLSGLELVRLAREITQTVDGKLAGEDPTGSGSRLVIYAVSSSWFDILSDSSEVFDRIHTRFSKVSNPEEWPNWA